MDPFEIDRKASSLITAADFEKPAFPPGAVITVSGAETPGPGRVRAELRSLAVALECYYIDNNRYPDKLEQLTDPIAYITSIPKDPFGPEGDNELRYKTDPQKKWILQSRGPDGDFDLDLQLFLDSDLRGEFLEAPNPGAEHVYDPKKGDESNGDILRVGP